MKKFVFVTALISLAVLNRKPIKKFCIRNLEVIKLRQDIYLSERLDKLINEHLDEKES